MNSDSSDSDCWDLLKPPPRATKRRRISHKTSVCQLSRPLDAKQQLWDEKLDKYPSIIREILWKIKVLDAKTIMFEHVKGAFVEMFSGGVNGRAVSKGFRRHGIAGSDFDLSMTPDHNFCKPYGFCLALVAVFFLNVSDPVWTGLVCTSFTWVNRATTERCAENKYLGNGLKHVKIGNMIVYRNMLILVMHHYFGGVTFLEQPLASCMPSLYIFRSTWRFLRWQYIVVWLGSYGAESKKPGKMFSAAPWIEHLAKPLPAGKTFTKLCTTKDGKATGKARELKDSQHYPEAFGEKVASEYCWHRLHKTVHRDEPFKPSLAEVETFISRHDWSLAKLDAVHAWLDHEIAQL